ncbi:MAG: FAD-dependent oxidoreductase [Ruminococcaceae bacterium]|nr:FAD-dependent oxidoreductase [Oscillospiraceae bacterium]
MYDIIVIGAGPAGLCAAVYALRAGKKVLILEKGAFGGQVTFSPKIENYPGMTSISGVELADKMVEQALFQGADVEVEEVLEIKSEDGIKKVVTDMGEHTAKAVIIATGAAHRHLGVEGEEKFIGEGISFCAICDGAFYSGKNVAVIGGGNSALQEALSLSEICKKVTIIQNLAFLTGEKRLADLIEKKDNIEVILSHTVEKVLGDDKFEGIVIKGEEGERELSFDGMFVAIGLSPATAPFKDVVELDKWGYVTSDESCTTKAEGIFVAGDCRTKQIRQISTAASDGAVAALAAVKFIES